jgi:radical SAM superfamily enzyme YgiQ (UPF0313 family)
MTAILLLSCYELGHQPLSLAWPLAALRSAGLEAEAVDLAVDQFPAYAARDARLAAIAVPMHTAMRIGVDAARRIRSVNPHACIVFYGLYAWLNRDYLLGGEGLADAVVAGEYEPTLVTLAQALGRGEDIAGVPGVTTRTQMAPPQLVRTTLPLPARDVLAPLERYAFYVNSDGGQPAGYVEASRGCLHTCRHCPIVPVYGGRFFVVPAATVLADIRQQVAGGAGHITFGDPDFLNGPRHSLEIARQLHAEFPDLTFDFTTKVEHILEFRDVLPRFAALGATFVVSAFEATSDAVLARLHKGHTLADMDAALAILRASGLAPQPTWMPFTPWTLLDDYLHLLHWMRTRDLIAHVPAVQLSIRMLIPPASALLEDNAAAPWLGKLDAPNFSYTWTHPDPRMDELQRQVTRIAERASDDDPYEAFAAVERAAYELAGLTPPAAQVMPLGAVPPPRLSEHWFC